MLSHRSQKIGELLQYRGLVLRRDGRPDALDTYRPIIDEHLFAYHASSGYGDPKLKLILGLEAISSAKICTYVVQENGGKVKEAASG